MEYIKVSGKTVNEAIKKACREFDIKQDELSYEVIDKGSNGFLGIGAREAIINAKINDVPKTAEDAKRNAEKFRLDVIKTKGREAEYQELLRKYNNAKALYGMSHIMSNVSADKTRNLENSIVDPYIAGGIANGLTGSGIFGAATVIQKELNNQKTISELKDAYHDNFNKQADEMSKKNEYERALADLNKLLIECGLTPFLN